MCGIAGIIHSDLSPVSVPVVRAMADSLRHRGPDDEGVYCSDHAGLGHRRLSTVDLSPAAHQPMVSACGRVALVYNGMLFNYRELRAELQSLGFVVRSSGDTAVVLAAWVAWGEACLLRLNGHFALAVLDFRENALFLARDRYGTKPLYWHYAGGIFLFASEIKAFLTHPSFSAQVDPQGLVEYFTFQNFLGERTLFAGVSLFPKASVGRIRLDAPEAPRISRYWDYAFQETRAENRCREALLEELDFLLRRAVGRHLDADVEVGAYLSGGIDSGLISSLAGKETPYLKSFTCGFDLSSASGMELGFDERRAAEAMSAAFRTEHYEMVLKSGDMERVMSRMARHIEEPRVGQSYPNYYIARLASKFVKIVLSGTGGDELFAGYPWRYSRLNDGTDFAAFTDAYYQSWQRLIPENILPEFLAPAWGEAGKADARLMFRNVFAGYPSRIERVEDAVNLSLYFEAHTFLQGLLLVDDKLSMAHGLETRSPFLDNDLVDFAMRCPVGLKLNNLRHVVSIDENAFGSKKEAYYRRTRDGKILLREIARRHLPCGVAEADKQGFSSPDASWFRGESMDFVRRTLLAPRKRMYEYVNYATAERLIHEHLEGRNNRRLLIWALLYFDCWLKTFIP
ncbi:MAG: asparagine synthase (glutamine-hydrolyzing) [Deltaproteobacteria bacterium]|nr:asparagine synthase (glutamine-hydrolyzing) [Deltaproteobacteria bacterium]